LGLSTHNLKEIEKANLLDLDYIGVGAYRKNQKNRCQNFMGIDYLEIGQRFQTGCSDNWWSKLSW